MRALVLASIATLGCSGPAETGEQPDAGGPPDAPGPPSCRSTDQFTGELPFTMTFEGERKSPSGLSGDELTAYFSVLRYPPSPPMADIHSVTRADIDAPFDGGAPIAGIASADLENGAVVSFDGLEIFYARETMPGIVIRIFKGSRGSVTEEFANPQELTFLERGVSPSVSADKSELFYLHLDSYTTSYPDIFRAIRAADTYGAPQGVVWSDDDFEVSSPKISADGLSLYYRSINRNTGDIIARVRRRTVVGGPFGADQALFPATLSHLGIIWESPDSCRAYVFNSDTSSISILTRTPN